MSLAPLAQSATAESAPEEFRCCEGCTLALACEGRVLDRATRRELHGLMRPLGPFPAGTWLFRAGDPFQAITAVHSGTVKTFVVDACGREQVLGFFQAGDILGLDAIHQGRHPCHAMTLDTVSLCSAPFPAMTDLATHAGPLQLQLFRLLSQDIRKAALLAGDYSADERVATFLMMLSQHRIRRGESGRMLELVMSRQDIANYLRLAAETVSRVLQRFQQEGLLRVDRRRVELLEPARLASLAVISPATAAGCPVDGARAPPSK